LRNNIIEFARKCMSLSLKRYWSLEGKNLASSLPALGSSGNLRTQVYHKSPLRLFSCVSCGTHSFLEKYFIVENKYTRKLLNLFVTKVNQNMDWYNQDIYRLTCITLSAFVIIHCVSLTNAYSFENVLKSSKNVCENRIKLGSK
jgi:hypothetical protein